MTYSFDPNDGCITVFVQVVGPLAAVQAKLALDTGATVTGWSLDLLSAIGRDPHATGHQTSVTTGSQVESMALVRVPNVVALGHRARGLIVLAHPLPPTAGLDGVLGLDFLEGHVLTIDFHAHTLTLT